MHYSFMTKNNLFQIYPTIQNCGEEELMNKLVLSLEKMKNREGYEKPRKIMECIIQKMQQSSWTKREYSYLRGQLVGLTPSLFTLLSPTLFTVLQGSDEEIEEDLKLFKQNTNFYPEIERVKNGNVYEAKEKPKTTVDIYYVLFSLTKNIDATIRRKAQTLTAEENPSIVMETIKSIINAENPEEKEEFLRNYQETYGFLKNTALFQDFYNLYKEEYLKILLQYVTSIYQNSLKEERRKKDNYNICSMTFTKNIRKKYGER